VGLQAAAGGLDQRLGPQVRPRVSRGRLDRLAGRRGAARRPDLLGQLPRRQHADVRAELLASGRQIVAQYYNFLRLGFDGYRKVQGYAREVATRLSGEIAGLGPFALVTKGDELPVFAFTLRDEVENYTVFDVSSAVRERGWLLPAYTFPKNREDLAVLRVVVKQGFTHDMADLLVNDLKRQLLRLQRQPAPVHDGTSATSFHH
jgi:glutamate/tyrosine decarboxylase-like PLP-dependent enzyme